MRHRGDGRSPGTPACCRARCRARPGAPPDPGARAPVAGRRRPAGAGLPADQPDLFARICGFTSMARASASWMPFCRSTPRATATRSTPSAGLTDLSEHYRELIAMVESSWHARSSRAGRCRRPVAAASRRARQEGFRGAARHAAPGRNQRWVLTISASDRVGPALQHRARAGAARINLQLAKVTTLGRQVRGHLPGRGPALQHNRGQIEIETELLASGAEGLNQSSGRRVERNRTSV